MMKLVAERGVGGARVSSKREQSSYRLNAGSIVGQDRDLNDINSDNGKSENSSRWRADNRSIDKDPILAQIEPRMNGFHRE